jgi:hypothetical protein
MKISRLKVHIMKASWLNYLFKKLSNHFTWNTVSNTDVLLGLVRKVMDTNAVSAVQRTQFPLNVPY